MGEAEADRDRNLDTRLIHASGKRRQCRTPHHIFECFVEIGVTGAFDDGGLGDPAAALNHKAEHRAALLAVFPGAFGIALVTFEPFAQ